MKKLCDIFCDILCDYVIIFFFAKYKNFLRQVKLGIWMILKLNNLIYYITADTYISIYIYNKTLNILY